MIKALYKRSYNHNDYTLKLLFVEDNNKALITMFDKDFKENNIKRHVLKVLHKIPVSMQTIFWFSIQQNHSLLEIARK